MVKKWMLLMLTMIFVLAGCSTGGSSSGGSTSGDAGKSPNSQQAFKDPVTLTYAVWDKNQVPAMEDIAKKFKETHPNIDVKVELTPNKQYWTKMETAAAGDSLPDVFWMNGPRFIKWAANGMLLPISDQIKADKVDMGNYPESLVKLYTVNGKNYGIPKDYDTIGLWYNKQMFDAAGVKYPDETWDWNKLLDAAKKLTDPSKGVWGIAAALDSQGVYYNMIPQNNGYVISDDKKTSGYDKPEAIEALKFWTDLILVHKVSPTQAQMTDTDPMTMFESGKVAMYFDGSWDAIEYAKNEYTKDKVNVTVWPQGKKRAAVIHGLANVIAAKTKHPKEAWEFVKFLGSKEAAEIQANTGTVIPAYKGTEAAWVKSIPSFNLKAFIDQVAYSVPYPVSKDSSKWQTAETDLFAKAWSGQMKIEDAARDLGKQMNDDLAQEK